VVCLTGSVAGDDEREEEGDEEDEETGDADCRCDSMDNVLSWDGLANLIGIDFVPLVPLVVLVLLLVVACTDNGGGDCGCGDGGSCSFIGTSRRRLASVCFSLLQPVLSKVSN
jgi:hypothetical protein